MLRIVETELELDSPLGQHRHCLVAQIPNVLRRSDIGYVVSDPDRQWKSVRSVLDVVARGDGAVKKLNFLLLPEGCVPYRYFDDVVENITRGFRPNTVTMFGLEHVRLGTYRALLERFAKDNPEALELLQHDLDSVSSVEMPANLCCIAVKESSGRVRVFLEAKGHPFGGEEFLEKSRDLYRGRHVYLFRARPAPYNFMALVCLDYLYRDLYASNIRQIVDHANQLYFLSRQSLDALFVLQCNPKPEHRAYRDVLSGFYGEYLEDTPGVRDTVTVFGNCSAESEVEGSTGGFGVSSVVIGGRHRLAQVSMPEFSTDDFEGAPICRLRFGGGTRLYYFNLPIHHELDPRSSRIPLKVHGIQRLDAGGEWVKISGDELMERAGLIR